MVVSVSRKSGQGLSEAPLGSPDVHSAVAALSPDAAQLEPARLGLVVGVAGDWTVSAAGPELFRPTAKGDGCA